MRQIYFTPIKCLSKVNNPIRQSTEQSFRTDTAYVRYKYSAYWPQFFYLGKTKHVNVVHLKKGCSTKAINT